MARMKPELLLNLLILRCLVDPFIERLSGYKGLEIGERSGNGTYENNSKGNREVGEMAQG